MLSFVFSLRHCQHSRRIFQKCVAWIIACRFNSPISVSILSSCRWGLPITPIKMNARFGSWSTFRQFYIHTLSLCVYIYEEIARECWVNGSPAHSLSLSPSLLAYVLIKFIFSNHIGIYYVCSINFPFWKSSKSEKNDIASTSIQTFYPPIRPNIKRSANTSKPRRKIFGCILQVMTELWKWWIVCISASDERMNEVW